MVLGRNLFEVYSVKSNIDQSIFYNMKTTSQLADTKTATCIHLGLEVCKEGSHIKNGTVMHAFADGGRMLLVSEDLKSWNMGTLTFLYVTTEAV